MKFFPGKRVETETTQQALQESLDMAFDAYGDAVRKLADEKFSEIVKPYLDKHCIAFRSGNGQYWFEKGGVPYWTNSHTVESFDKVTLIEDGDEEGWVVFDVVQAYVPGQVAISFGNYLPTYTPPNYAMNDYTIKMTAIEFEEKTGQPPIQDDLERVNCTCVGEVGHSQCGWCYYHNVPKYTCMCTHPVNTPHPQELSTQLL